MAEEGGWWQTTEAMQSKKALSTRRVLAVASDSSANLLEVAEVLAAAFALRKSDISLPIRQQVICSPRPPGPLLPSHIQSHGELKNGTISDQNWWKEDEERNFAKSRPGEKKVISPAVCNSA